MEINKRILILIFFGLIVFSLCFAAGKEMFYGYQLEKFFGNHKEGKIIFVSAFGDHNEFYAFYLLDRKIKKYPQGKFIQTQKRLSAELPGSFSPDKKFKVYEYAYDRDDLSKIFVANIKTRETILLAQGESPVWIR